MNLAKIELKGIERYEKQLANLGAAVEGICKFASYEAAGIVIDSIKKNCPVDTGDLRDSFVLTQYRNENGFIYTKVVSEGYDSKGVPNPLKARAIESGTSRTPARPFIRPAVNSVKKAAEFSIEKNLDKKLKEYMKE